MILNKMDDSPKQEVKHEIVRNKKGQFEKGHSGNMNGSLNKKRSEIQNLLADFCLEKIPELYTLWDSLPPKEKTKMVCSILRFVVPQAADNPDGTDSQVTIVMNDRTPNK